MEGSTDEESKVDVSDSMNPLKLCDDVIVIICEFSVVPDLVTFSLINRQWLLCSSQNHLWKKRVDLILTMKHFLCPQQSRFREFSKTLVEKNTVRGDFLSSERIFGKALFQSDQDRIEELFQQAIKRCETELAKTRLKWGVDKNLALSKEKVLQGYCRRKCQIYASDLRDGIEEGVFKDGMLTEGLVKSYGITDSGLHFARLWSNLDVSWILCDMEEFKFFGPLNGDGDQLIPRMVSWFGTKYGKRIQTIV